MPCLKEPRPVQLRNVQVQGGQVSLVWQNSDPTAAKTRSSPTRFLAEEPASSSTVQSVRSTLPRPSRVAAATPATTSFTDKVSFTPAQSGLTFTNLDVTLAIVHPHLSQIEIQLSHGSTTVTLVFNAVTSSGTTIMPAQGLADNGGSDGLGVVTYKDPTGKFIEDVEPVGATFDDQAPRNILDMNTTLPYAQLNQPEGENPPPNTPVSALSDFFPNNGTATASQLSGDWTLIFVDFVAPTGTTAPVQFVYSWSLNFTAGMKFAGQKIVAGHGVGVGRDHLPFTFRLRSQRRPR